VNQTSQNAIINWNSFSVGPAELTRFNQPNATSITLNRVTGGDPSEILGAIRANGQVWLINPNGIAFGKSATVDVSGLLATTLEITNQDFLAHNYRFTATGHAPAAVTNAGQLTIRGAGLAALVAPNVANAGVIQARLGRIALASADGFTVDFYGDGKFNFILNAHGRRRKVGGRSDDQHGRLHPSAHGGLDQRRDHPRRGEHRRGRAIRNG